MKIKTLRCVNFYLQDNQQVEVEPDTEASTEEQHREDTPLKSKDTQ